ncbi:MAG: hypothetical protein F6K16_24175, partial [Symploca sp. SIO2B6]|nr:hypothetical protein [Symploca sp. SIO2B6]
LKAACQSGQLKCKNRLFSLSSFAPDIHPEYVDSFVKSLGDVSQRLVEEPTQLNLISGDEADNTRKAYEKVTREPADFPRQRTKPINKFKDSLIAALTRVYQSLLSILLGLAVFGLVLKYVSSFFACNQEKNSWLPLVSIILTCILVRVVLMAYIDATSFPIGLHYLWSVVPLMLMAMALGVSYLVEISSLISKRIRRALASY